MWSFIKTFLACLFAMVFFFVFVLIFITAIAAIGGSGKSAGIAEKEGVLLLDLNYDVREKSPENPLNFSFGEISYSKKLGLAEVLQSIEAAKTDEKVKGIYLPLGIQMDCGYASVEAIRNQLKDFKKSGKFVIAYGEVSSQKAYYLATAASKIYINPTGGIDFRGFGGQITFLKGMLDKLNISTQVYYAGKFKSATEPFRYTQMSEPNKQQVREYLSDFSKIVLTNISQDRKIDLNALNQYIDSMSITVPEKAKEFGLVDDLLYYDQLLALLASESKLPKEKKVDFIDMETYYEHVKGLESENDNKIAVVVAQGDIIDGKGDENSIGGEKYAEILRNIREDDEVKAVVLRVNSGGGSVLASDIIWRELELLKAKKVVVASMGDVAASGGYYISAGAKRIFAQPNTITGSIGVFGVIPNLQGFFNEKLGVTFDEVEIHQHAVMNINKPLDEYEANFVQKRIDRIYQDFLRIVAKGRKMQVAAVDSIAQGRVWSGVKAKEIGLIDEIGSLEDAIAFAAKEAKIKLYTKDMYPKEKDPFRSILEDMETSASSYLIRSALQKQGLTEEFKYLKMIQKYRKYTGIKMEMPMEIEIN